MVQKERNSFEKEVIKGLTDFPKHLSSRFIYDHRGDELFQAIMAMPGYYLTHCEHEILTRFVAEISTLMQESSDSFDLIELGAGDGEKTKIVLQHLLAKNIDFTYVPIDISHHALNELKKDLRITYPGLPIETIQGEYFQALQQIQEMNQRKKVIFFLGSNIGNLLHPQAIDFLTKIKDTLSEKDLLFIGADQKKDPAIILEAYNDEMGITASFNKNLLRRINREFDADFNPDQFRHWEVYDPETGTAKSYLVALDEIEVSINALHLKVHFDRWETIHTEISQKYDAKTIEWLAQESGLEIVQSYTDSKEYFKNYFLRKRKD